MKPLKTNAMRLLDQKQIPYQVLSFPYNEKDFDGTHVADAIQLPYAQVYKTLVFSGGKQGAGVFCIPVDKTINVKKAAVLLGEKKTVLYPVEKLYPLTGYVRGGCSPIGMKRKLPLFFHDQILTQNQIAVSAGTRGLQIFLSPVDLLQITHGQQADLL
ncbi:MAG: Cys-tRNA(Pro) deacylase [Clostridiales bacterium]|nr:Cys-tRNA(Pro) deacylase [Clostridiales bacterium]